MKKLLLLLPLVGCTHLETCEVKVTTMLQSCQVMQAQTFTNKSTGTISMAIAAICPSPWRATSLILVEPKDVKLTKMLKKDDFTEVAMCMEQDLKFQILEHSEPIDGFETTEK